MRRAPLHSDALALAAGLLDAIDDAPRHRVLRDRIGRGALRLVDAVVLATTGIERLANLHHADAEVATLRAHLQLALELGLLPEDFVLDAAAVTDRIGRQLGGWLRKLDRAQPRATMATAPADP